MAILLNHRDITHGSFYGDIVVDDGPWICCGHFNEVLSISKKTGDHLKPVVQIEEFRRAIEDVGLQEFKFLGYEFTWSKVGA